MEHLRILHNQLLEQKPEGASHDVASCPFCSGTTTVELALEGGAVDKTYTEDELKAAIAEATKELETKVAELSAADEQAKIDAAVSEAVAAKEDRIKELEASLDSAVLETQKAKDEYEAIVAFLKETEEAAAREAEVAARREERLAKVAEVASFPEEYVAANADRWANLSNEDFEALVADWAAIAPKKETSTVSEETEVPSTAAIETASRQAPVSAVRDVLSLTLRGIDPRTL